MQSPRSKVVSFTMRTFIVVQNYFNGHQMGMADVIQVYGLFEIK